MRGNVWEWVSDWYGNGYYARSPVDSPQGQPMGAYECDAVAPGILGLVRAFILSQLDYAEFALHALERLVDGGP